MSRPYVPRFYSTEGFCLLSVHSVCQLLNIRITRIYDEQARGLFIMVYLLPTKATPYERPAGRSKTNECIWTFVRRLNLLEKAAERYRKLTVAEQDRLRNIVPYPVEH